MTIWMLSQKGVQVVLEMVKKSFFCSRAKGKKLSYLAGQLERQGHGGMDKYCKCELLDVKTRHKHRKVYKFQIANGLEALAKESGLFPKDSQSC